MRRICYVIIFLSSSLSMANASTDSLSAGYLYNNYSDGHGYGNVVYAELKKKVDHSTTVVNITHGRRNYGNGEAWNAFRGKVTVWYDWNSFFSTRTGISVSENTPVFARKDLQQDLSFKLIHNLLFTTGYRYANYFGDTDVNSFSGKISLYTGPVISSWRYTHYNTQGKGGSYSNIISFQLNDLNGKGNTQLWLSRGTGAYTYDWLSETHKGTLESISLRRIQPLTDRLNLGVTLGKQWYNTPIDNYSNLQVAADFIFAF
ncbi:YaiO family outer membrane beta-barrel protein [Salmonella enterica]|nr:YaiO family outer membrane beta-barrel protein [Salmonella enterica]EEJ9029282.1 YaiO family outer membrane beta-barrel protein [Salmonella enterica subsp. enterica]